MTVSPLKRNIVLSILFFLPVAFIIVMLLAKDNYNPLDIVKENITELPSNKDSIQLKNHITVLSFFGEKPLEHSVAALNLKELIYDTCKGFKTFQIVTLVPFKARKDAEQLFAEIKTYEDLRFWHMVYLDEHQIENVFQSLKTEVNLEQLGTNSVFIIDKDKHQRGRIDDRTKKEVEKNAPVYPLHEYNGIKIAELKNKMAAEDMRVLFTEYRDKRVGKFEGSTKRRNKDLKNE